jgi:hypothetical protein
MKEQNTGEVNSIYFKLDKIKKLISLYKKNLSNLDQESVCYQEIENLLKSLERIIAQG